MSPDRLPDDIDRRLLELLKDDARLSMTELAERAGVSRANAYSRVERLRAEGVLLGFTTRVDPRKIGLPIAALLTIQVEQHAWRTVGKKIAAMPEVEYLAVTAGDFDMAALVRAPDVETLRDVILVRLQGMPEVRATRTILVLDDQLGDEAR